MKNINFILTIFYIVFKKNSKTENIPNFFEAINVILNMEAVILHKNGIKMNILVQTNKIINFSHRNTLSFITKECDFSLLQLAKQTYTNFCKNIEENLEKNNIIEIPINFVFKQATCAEIINKPSKTQEISIKSKPTIENICNCLEPIAKTNCNRFIYKNIDINIYTNKAIFSRLILNLCYQLLSNSKKNAAIEILSYLDVEQYIIEFITEYSLTSKMKKELETLKPLLEQIKSDFSYEELPNGEIAFKIIMPYENTRF